MTELVQGRDKSIALDSASILGGNEVMVAQLLNEQHNKIYDNDERLILDWALNAVWPKKAIDDFYKTELDMISQKQFTSLLPPMIQRDLARVVANCLLYCVRYDDTTVWTHSENPTWRIILVNTKHIPEVQKVHIGGKTCDKLAFIYKKSIPRQQIINTPGSSPNQFTGSPTNQVTGAVEAMEMRIRSGSGTYKRTRKISQSVSMEHKMVRQINLIAVLPAYR